MQDIICYESNSYCLLIEAQFCLLHRKFFVNFYTMNNLLKLKWTRPQTTEYPKVWKTFYASDIDNVENLVAYRIQDLPESRFDDAIQHMIANYLKDEPVTATLSKFFKF